MSFDYKQALKEHRSPEYFKAGVEYYINANNLKPKNKNELDKIIDDFKKLKI